MNTKILGLAFALMFTTTVIAQDAPAKKKKAGANRNAPAAQLLKQLKDVDLTDEQKTKIQELAKKSMADMRSGRKEAGITPELMKKRTAAMKELKESGKKPAEIAKALNEKIGLNETQIAYFKKQAEGRTALLKSAVALLTDEQKAKLPARMTRTGGKGGQGKGKGKGKGKKKAE